MDMVMFFGYLVAVVVMLVKTVLGLRHVFRGMLLNGLTRRVGLIGGFCLILIAPVFQGCGDDHSDEQFYREQWKKFTGNTMSEDAVLIAKAYDPPNVMGDYTVAMAIRLDATAYEGLQRTFSTAPFQEARFRSGEEEWAVLSAVGLTGPDDLRWFCDRERLPFFQLGFHQQTRTVVLSGFGTR